MRILVVTPFKKRSRRGNRITADRIARILKQLGHRVEISTELEPRRSNRGQTGPSLDLLIALHAGRSAVAVKAFRNQYPDKPVVVMITGTDIHRDIDQGPVVEATLQLADRIVLLEPECRKRLDAKLADKSVVIFQSAQRLARRPAPLKRCFEVSLVGHLRDVKDPFLIVEATRCLPESSRIKVVHLGEALTLPMKRRAERESLTNPRYQWLGEKPHGETIRRIARSRLTVLTSRIEGAPSVISEAIVNDVPVLSTRIDASIGMLGGDYPGLFPVGDASALAALLSSAESDSAFYQQLRRHCRQQVAQVQTAS